MLAPLSTEKRSWPKVLTIFSFQPPLADCDIFNQFGIVLTKLCGFSSLLFLECFSRFLCILHIFFVKFVLSIFIWFRNYWMMWFLNYWIMWFRNYWIMWLMNNWIMWLCKVLAASSLVMCFSLNWGVGRFISKLCFIKV